MGYLSPTTSGRKPQTTLKACNLIFGHFNGTAWVGLCQRGEKQLLVILHYCWTWRDTDIMDQTSPQAWPPAELLKEPMLR